LSELPPSSHKAGFTAVVDTRDAFQAALQSFIDRNLLPPAQI
jgi:hypothetical protein